MKRLVADTGPILHLHEAGAIHLLAPSARTMAANPFGHPTITRRISRFAPLACSDHEIVLNQNRLTLQRHFRENDHGLEIGVSGLIRGIREVRGERPSGNVAVVLTRFKSFFEAYSQLSRLLLLFLARRGNSSDEIGGEKSFKG